QSRVTRQHERELVESLGMRWVSLPMRMYWRPQDAYTEALSLGLAEWNPFMRGLILREASRYGEPTSQLVSTR
ncbi:MAG: hypothetical protein HY598_05310, partial [Candidatus Omnitrophica bacterium]|nr:hypothetical protein [Candidatus Omnitrophota bacterium]